MSPSERRQALLAILSRERHSTYERLAREFGVTRRTIQNDVQILIGSYPIETVRGRYGGGVQIVTGHKLRLPHEHLNSAQIDLLIRLRVGLDGEDRRILDSILSQFAT